MIPKMYRDDGLYRDDVSYETQATKKIDQTRKSAIKVFEDDGCKTEINTNLKTVDFLDATFNLLNGTYSPSFTNVLRQHAQNQINCA